MTGGRKYISRDRKLGRAPLSVSREMCFGQDPSSTRGYTKIAGAAEAFHFDFRGKTVLDIGSSTGGFTKYALDHGASKVIAVEKGTDQMESPLRFDPHIELHEKTDIFNVKVQDTFPEDRRLGRTALSVSEGEASCTYPDVIVADVSFLSLRKVLTHARRHLADKHTDFLVMLKPQFEAESYQLNRGVVKNEKIRREIIKEFEHWLKQNNFIIVKKRDNQLKGKTGNKERFYYLKLAK